MSRRSDMAASAYREALRLRSRAGRPTNSAVCPFDLAELIGVEVRFVDIPSMEAMYVDDGDPKILVAADRPPGRQRFSCAHEIGHHVFGHGTHLSRDDMADRPLRATTDEEFLAQAFAGYLLLPKAAVSHAFAVRRWDPRSPVPEHYYTVASQLGVGFDSLVTHCHSALRILGPSEAAALRPTRLAEIRSRVAGRPLSGDLLILDRFAGDWAADLRVGDYLLAPPDFRPVNDALGIEDAGSNAALLRARRPGLSGVGPSADSPVTIVRISRASFVGRSIFRHLEDPDYAR